jgi:hypothetical protein
MSSTNIRLLSSRLGAKRARYTQPAESVPHMLHWIFNVDAL